MRLVLLVSEDVKIICGLKKKEEEIKYRDCT